MKKLLFLLVSAFCGSFAANATLSTTEFASNDYVKEWGRLKLVGNQLSSESGEAVQLKGWSTFSINYTEVVNCLSDAAFDAMKAWGANVVRLAIYPNNSQGSYDSSVQKMINLYIDMCASRGMYCLVDWHVLEGDGDSGTPSTYQDNAKIMFDKTSQYVATKGYKNVLYEACNEPSDQVNFEQIKTYVNGYVAPVLNDNCPEGAILIVGTPSWDQEVGQAVNSPIDRNKYSNLGLMYAFHYYACSHEYLLGNFKSACASLPMFVSEWGSGVYDGDGSICTDQSNELLTACKRGNLGDQLVSWCYWAWGEKNEYSNCLSTCTSTFTKSILTTSGSYIYDILTGGVEVPDPTPSTAYKTPS